MPASAGAPLKRDEGGTSTSSYTKPEPGRLKMSSRLEGTRLVSRIEADRVTEATYVMNGTVVATNDPLHGRLEEFRKPWRPDETERVFVTEVLEAGQRFPPKGFKPIRPPSGHTWTATARGMDRCFLQFEGSSKLYKMEEGVQLPLTVRGFYFIAPDDLPDAMEITITAKRRK